MVDFGADVWQNVNSGGPMLELINWVTSHSAEIFQVVTGIIAVASIIVNLTPTEADNKALDFVLKILHVVALDKTATKK